MSFPCPKCKKPSGVVDSRPVQSKEGPSVMRRRECKKGHRFTTYEMLAAQQRMPYADISKSIVRNITSDALLQELNARIPAFSDKESP